jgi:endonuclease/exonuclease/phosphatase family metal-dependent hydrolase
MRQIAVRAGVAAAVSAGLSTGAGAGTPPPVPLRVVTFNALGGIGNPGSPEANAIGKFITVQDLDGAGPNVGLSPDIVLFQEMNQTNTTQVTNFRNVFLPGYDIRTATGDGFNYNATLIRPGIAVISHSSLSIGGPRGAGKTRIRVPGALRDVVVYNAHFKSGSSSADQTQRTTNATTCGNNVSFEYFNNNVNVIFGGDLNSNNNQDGTITNLFFTSTNPVISSGILNLAVETLAGAANPGATILTTFPGSGSRLDYVCLDEQLAAFFDTDMNGSYTQTERNAMGFVYYSNEDSGQRSNGDATATNSGTSDHRPVVFDALLPRDPMAPYFEPADVDQSGAVTIEDLYRWETLFLQTAPPAPSPAPDVDGNRNVDGNDRIQVRSALRIGEVADISAF